MDFIHILDQKETIWNTIFGIFERRRGPPNVTGPGKTFPPFPPLDGPVYHTNKFDGYLVLAEWLCSWTFNFLEVVHRHILGEVADLIPPFLQFIQEYDSERIIKIGPYLWELWGIMCVPQFFETRCSSSWLVELTCYFIFVAKWTGWVRVWGFRVTLPKDVIPVNAIGYSNDEVTVNSTQTQTQTLLWNVTNAHKTLKVQWEWQCIKT